MKGTKEKNKMKEKEEKDERKIVKLPNVLWKSKRFRIEDECHDLKTLEWIKKRNLVLHKKTQ